MPKFPFPADPVIALRRDIALRALSYIGKVEYELYADWDSRGDGKIYADCSSFTKRMWFEASTNALAQARKDQPNPSPVLNRLRNLKPIVLPHNALEQSNYLWHPRAHGDRIRTGDALFYYQPISHCGIAWWDGPVLRVIQASNPFYDVNVIRADQWAPIVGVGRPHNWLVALQKGVGFKV